MTEGASVLFLSQEDVLSEGGVDFDTVIGDLIRAYALLDRGEAINPIGPSIHLGGSDDRFLSVHAGWLGSDLNIAGVKLVARSSRNPVERHLPSIIALIVLVDPLTGLPLAVMDGTLITSVRTGASTAVGAKYLARTDSRVLAVIGAGVMARTQVLALARVLPALAEVRVFDIMEEKAKAFAASVESGVGLRALPVRSPRAAIEGADIVAPATTVSLAAAYILPQWIAPGAFLANVSDNDYTFDAVLRADRIVVDGPKQFGARVTTGEMKRQGLLDERHVVTIGQIINGTEVGRTGEQEICFFSAMGLGVHDVICAHRILKSAQMSGRGQHLELWRSPHWM